MKKALRISFIMFILLGFLGTTTIVQAQNPKALKKQRKSNKKKQKAKDEPIEYNPRQKDSDNDGVMDYADHCPATPKGQAVTPFGCPVDRDFDGTLDTLDNCPDVKGPKENIGCPWPDTDGDGLLDKDDHCPKEKGPKENQGCPWGDHDEDGILDKDDKCPYVFGALQWKGCPDTDGDDIADYEDKCPEEPGVKENHGCPGLDEEEQKVIEEAFKNLLFQSGKAIIISTSYESLDKLAIVLETHSNAKLLLDGHTDNVGDFYANQELSEDRAEAVKAYLILKGITSHRIKTKGHGETQAVDTNDTEEGRKNNRRVEMTIIHE